jgi:hypothetical protein
MKGNECEIINGELNADAEAQRRRMAENKISKVKVDAAILPIYLTTEPMIGNRQS